MGLLVFKSTLWHLFDIFFFFSAGNYLIMPSGNLQIANATQDDEGPYKCAAYNPVTQEVKTSTSADRLRIRRESSSPTTLTLRQRRFFISVAGANENTI